MAAELLLAMNTSTYYRSGKALLGYTAAAYFIFRTATGCAFNLLSSMIAAQVVPRLYRDWVLRTDGPAECRRKPERNQTGALEAQVRGHRCPMCLQQNHGSRILA